jgi:ubiquinol-cytochrome c reductase iron-sulfur subunit
MSAIVLNEVDPKKRRFLIVATSVVGAGATVAGAVPFVASMFPSARAVAAGGPVEVDLAKIEPGQMLTVEYRGAPHWVIKRTPEMVAQLAKNDKLLADPKSDGSIQPEYAKNDARAIKPEIFVVRGVCTHLGCSPTFRKEVGAADLGAEWPGGFFCPCHQSKFDMSGRVFKGMPAPKNLVVTPYKVAGTTLVIDADMKGA